jgi:hypothetical protein
MTRELKEINLIVFTITTSIKTIQEAIDLIDNNLPIYLLSPHIAFENEIKNIKDNTSREMYFISFYEFINQEEMEYCDTQADILIVNEFNSRLGHLNHYYNKIKILKNNIILKNNKNKFNIQNKYILADDLGIDIDIWTNNNFINNTINKKVVNKNNIFQKLNNMIFSGIECNILKNDNESYYLLGKPNRTLQYLKIEDIKIVKFSYLYKMLFNILYKLSILKSKNIPIGFVLNQAIKLFKNKKINKFIVPIHEHTDSYSYLSEEFNCKYIVLQDGYLPNYYTSAYLKYWEKVDKYYIWDKSSEGIFKRHNLPYKKWNMYRDNRLPILQLKDSFNIKKIVFLSSGAGDWTALKNRSDEDLILLALINVSKIFKNIQFVFRPHPLWLHPLHQGINSIQRVVEYIDSLRLDNFKISGGALKEGLEFTRHQNLSTASSSIDEDINTADIILGDHSQSMITAAKRGKLISSISLTKRKEFFSNYTDLGFQILKSEDDIKNFINILSNQVKREKFLIKYNNSIKLYNTEYS